MIVEFAFKRAADFEAAWDRMAADPHSEGLLVHPGPAPARLHRAP